MNPGNRRERDRGHSTIQRLAARSPLSHVDQGQYCELMLVREYRQGGQNASNVGIFVRVRSPEIARNRVHDYQHGCFFDDYLLECVHVSFEIRETLAVFSANGGEHKPAIVIGSSSLEAWLNRVGDAILDGKKQYIPLLLLNPADVGPRQAAGNPCGYIDRDE